VCKLRASAADDDCVEMTIVKHVNAVDSDLPLVAEPQPFPVERQIYLAEKIRPYVTDGDAKDILCPFPCSVEESPAATEPIAGTSSPGITAARPTTHVELVAPKKTPVCSYCKESGHRNQVRNKIDLCPKMKKDEGDT